MSHLKTAHELERYTLLAADGEIGHVHQYYFDRSTWMIRYLAVILPAGPMDRLILISPLAVGDVSAQEKIIHIELTSAQVINSPALTVGRPLSRQFEVDYYRYYGWPVYWKIESPNHITNSKRHQVTQAVRHTNETVLTGSHNNLLDTADVVGSKLFATDGEVGCVNDYLIDIRYWVIRYLDVTTGATEYDKHILVSPGWIQHVNWQARAINVDIPYGVILNSPRANPMLPIDRAYEARLFDYYGRRYYWRQQYTHVSDG